MAFEGVKYRHGALERLLSHTQGQALHPVPHVEGVDVLDVLVPVGGLKQGLFEEGAVPALNKQWRDKY